MSFTPEEIAAIETNGLSQEEVEKVLEMFPQSVDTAIGYIVGLKRGQGQERTEPFAPEAAPEQEKSNGDAAAAE